MALSYSPFFVGEAPVVIGLGVLRVEPDGLGEVGNRLVVFALLPVGEAPVAIRLGIFRVQPDGLGVVGNRLVVFALLPVGKPRLQYAVGEISG